MPAVPTNPDDGGLRNTIYRRQTRSARRLTRVRSALYRSLVVPFAFHLVRLVWSWCRIVRVDGAEHVAQALHGSPSFIPVYWHQHQLFGVKTLLDRRDQGVRLGFLISPSVDGEIGAMLVARLRAVAIRGSSSYTGARALRDYYHALVRDGVSPSITPDGPRGPPWQFKPGAILLAQISRRPIVPISYAASRAWMFHWDRFVIPKPFARIAIAIGEPVWVPKVLDAAGLEQMQRDMRERLQSLYATARSMLV
ncbi:MAG TPA: lysophospholipid acyltransferase family protein [Steroidobacteraceae bacterium]|nr:lysophospholipid acyltransferase family protein [Steroidobacteraceae bacterium]